MQYTEEYNRDIRRFNLYENTQIPMMTFPDYLFDISLNLDYVLDRYFKEMTYAVDTLIAKGKLSDVFHQFIVEFQIVISHATVAIENEMRRQQIICEGLELEFTEQKKVYEEFEKCNEQIDEQIRQAQIGWQQDLERSKQLDLFLMESFVEQSNWYKAKLLNDQTSIKEKWMVHQFWNVLKLQAERIIDYVN